MSISLYRNAVTRITRERANLEGALSRERERYARLQSDLGRLSRDVSATSSYTTIQSKLRQAETKERDLAAAQRKIADLSAKLANKLDELNRNVRNLEQAEERERHKQEQDSKRQRHEALRHTREVTREIERQARIHRELRQSPLVIDLSRLPEKIRVLFLAANPEDQTRLRLDQEVRDITEKIRLSEHRDSVELISRWAVRPQDLLQALNEHRPHVIHFSGHGSTSGEIFLEDTAGSSKVVPADAIAGTLRTMADNVRLVVFNACFSVDQAKMITQNIEVAVGMDAAIGDEAARVFAAQFYSAIGFGRSVQSAFDQGIAGLQLEGIPEDQTPQLFVKDGVDPMEIVLVRPPQGERRLTQAGDS